MGGSQPLFQHGLYPPQNYPKIIIILTNFTKSSTPRCTWSSKFYIAALHPLHPAFVPLCFSHRSATELQRDAQQVQLLGHVEAVGVAHGGGHDEVATMLQRGLVQTFTWGMVFLVGKFIWDLSEIHDVEKMMLEIGGKNCWKTAWSWRKIAGKLEVWRVRWDAGFLRSTWPETQRTPTSEWATKL